MKTLFSLDTEFINKFYRLHAELGTTQKCCDYLETLSETQSEPWKSISLGLRHILQGDGIRLRTYNNKEQYEQAYLILDKIQKRIRNKERLLYLFVERNKLDALALTLTRPIKEIEESFNKLIEKFRANRAPAFQTEIAKAMLSKSFILWKYSNEAKEQGFPSKQKDLFQRSTQESDKIIDTYDSDEYVDNAYIQTTIAKTLINKAIDLDTISEQYKEKSNQKFQDIVSKYGQSDNDGIQIEVAKAMYNIASELYHKKIVADAEVKNTMREPKKPIGVYEVVNEYEKLKIKYCDSSVYEILEYVLLSMIFQFSIYDENDMTEEALGKHEELINFYNAHKESFSAWADLIDYIQPKRSVLQKQLNAEIIQKEKYDELRKIEYDIEKLYEFYPDNKKHIECLTQSICDGQIVPFAGAGLSHFMVDDKYAYPLWGELVDGIYEKYMYYGCDKTKQKRERLADAKEDFNNKPCIDKATFLKDQLGQALFGMEIINIFKQRINHNTKEKLKHQPYILFPLLFKRFVLTTNFDNLIEFAYQECEQYLTPCSAYDINKIDCIDSDRTILYKIHGTIDQPNSIILTREDYNKHYSPDSDNCKILSKYLSGHSVLFMGCSLDEDDDIMPFYNKKINYAIYPCTKEEIGTIEQKLSKKNIIPILFPYGEYHYIYSILNHCYYEKNNYEYLNLSNLFAKAQNKLGKLAMKTVLEHIIHSDNYNNTSNAQGIHKNPINEDDSIPVFSNIKFKQ
ncbi:MAG: SIR2 family protein [Alistipes sp.]|nr:SIR2 family protein [Alistipes sp.]